MLLSYGAFLFLYLFIPGLSAKDNIDDFSFWGAPFLRLIIPPAAAGGIVKIVFLRGLSFFAAICGAGTAP